MGTMITSSQLRLVAQPMTTLLVSPTPSDHAALKHIFSRSNWHLRSVFNCQEALTLLREESIPVVLCNRQLPDGSWRDLVECADSLPLAPRVIVSSREVNEYLWADVLQMGAYDVLAMPWEAREVLKVIALAWRSWEFAHRVVSRPVRSVVAQEKLTLAAAGA
jgi:DNA-binding NtrC family response regulator